MRISESALRKIIKEEIDDQRKKQLFDNIDSIYQKLSVNMINSPDKIRIRRLEYLLLELMKALQNNLR